MPKTASLNAATDFASIDSMSYEQALAELEGLVSRMEGGQMPLDELLSGYARGAQLLKACRDKLQAVEQQIKLIDSPPDPQTGASGA
jgi:exodeoxyribonuclease VII small subunit